MPAPPPRPAGDDTAPRARIEEFAQSVHASYLSRWLTHDPKALLKLGEESATERRRARRTSAA